MIFRQLFDYDSYTYTYLLASRRGGEAIIVDPVLERVNRYIQLLEELELKLVKAVDTHLHADHITGLGALRDRTRCMTIMGQQSKADVVAMRVADGDHIDAEGIRLEVIYTPGHTDDSNCYRLDNMVFTGDTLLIRGTGRTDFQNGDAHAQYDSIFNRLLKLPDDTLVYPGHDYKGDTVSTVFEERKYNPRLQVKSEQEYVELMNNLDLANPKMMDVAVPSNMHIGMSQKEIEECGWALDASSIKSLLNTGEIVLVDLRDKAERERHGMIPGSVHAPYSQLDENVSKGGMLHELVKGNDKKLVFYCAFGERSAMAVEAAQEQGLNNACHLAGGMDAWKQAEGPLETL